VLRRFHRRFCLVFCVLEVWVLEIWVLEIARSLFGFSSRAAILPDLVPAGRTGKLPQVANYFHFPNPPCGVKWCVLSTRRI
jgi:hypothetical protein